jgi:AcrR family transcriptional regulator
VSVKPFKLSGVQVDHRKGPRRRGEVLEDAIMQAALAELAEVGYMDVSMERIASRARTSKAAVYRRWPDRAHLIVDSYIRFVVHDVETPDTGSLRSDVILLMRQLADLVTSPVVVMLFGLLVDARDNGELRGVIRERVGTLKPWLMSDILERAGARGELTRTLTERQMTLPIDLLRNEIVQCLMRDDGGEVSESTIVEIVDEIFLPLVCG